MINLLHNKRFHHFESYVSLINQPKDNASRFLMILNKLKSKTMNMMTILDQMTIQLDLVQLVVLSNRDMLILLVNLTAMLPSLCSIRLRKELNNVYHILV